MERKRNRYKDMERTVTLVLFAVLLLFIFYLVSAANGIIWLKVVLGILTLIISVLCLLFLYYTGEIGKHRSLWMSTAFAAITVCLLFSLILNYPSPKPPSVNESSGYSTTDAT